MKVERQSHRGMVKTHTAIPGPRPAGLKQPQVRRPGRLESVQRSADAAVAVGERDRLLARSFSTCPRLGGVASEISQRELRNSSGEIMRQLDQGESFVVTRNGVPVGELSPVRRNRFVSAQAAVTAFKGAQPVDFSRFRADLDRGVSQEIAPGGSNIS